MRVGVSPNNTNQPMMLMMSVPGSIQSNMLYLINMFTTGTPPSSAFSVPPSCGPSVEQQLMKNAEQPSLIMPPFMMDPTGEMFKKMADVGKH